MTSENPVPDGTNPYPDAFTKPEAAGTVAIVPVSRSEIDAILAPFQIDMRTWLRGVVGSEDFPEADPDAMVLGMLAQILGAASSEEALSALNLDRAKEMCGNEPGGKSPVLEIHGARALKSDYADGAGCYVIVNAIRLDTGQRVSFSTGSKAVQTVIWKHMWEGWMPFRAMLEIRKERTKAGYYPLNLVQGI